MTTMPPHPVRTLLLVSLVAIVTAASHPPQPPPDTSMTTCPSVCFCDDTHYVSCVGDGLWEIPTQLPVTVTRLELRNYAVGTLPSRGLLTSLVRLVEVKLQQTQIAQIENATFSNLTRLLRLDVSENVLKRVSGATFEGLTSLRYLDLSSNRLNEVDEAFVDLVNLEQLNLRDNLLPQLTSHTFVGLFKLQYLNLDRNNISSIEVGTFQYMTNLAHLIVSNNPLTTLSRLDFFGSRLQYIDVSQVQLQRVPQSLTRYVRDLRLAKNNLTHIRLGDFDSYPYLSLLVLDDNRLEDIESDALGRLEFLLRLWLNGNRLAKIPVNLPSSLCVLYVEENLVSRLSTDSFQGLFNLEQLFLKRNQIRSIESDAFSDLLSLTHLDLQANLIETIAEGSFFNLSSLKSLDLSQNPLKTIVAGSFMGLDGLKTLLMSRMKVSIRFDGAVFDPLKRLESLEVYDSPVLAAQLVNSTRALQGLRNLRELNLMHNNLAFLRQDFPHFFPQLKVAKLSGNQWNCDKNLLWFTTWLTKSDTHFYHSYGIRCSRPHNLLFKPVVMLKEEDFQNATTKPQTLKLETTTQLPVTSTVTTQRPTSTTTKWPTLITTQTSTTTKWPTLITTQTLTTTKQSTSTTTQRSTSTTQRPTSTTQRPTSTTQQPTSTTQRPTSTTTQRPIMPTTPLTTSSDDDLPMTNLSTPTELSINLTTTVYNLTLDEITWTTKNESWINVTSPNVTQSPSVIRLQQLPPDESLMAAISICTGLGLVLLGVTTSFFLFRWRKVSVCGSGFSCVMRRSSSSISYSPHRDEVSIVTVSDGTVGLSTLTHQGLSNKLYFVLESGGDPHSRDVTKAALPDPSLAQLLPSSDHVMVVTPHRSVTRTNTYCFT